jgi:hypothetical protein
MRTAVLVFLHAGQIEFGRCVHGTPFQSHSSSRMSSFRALTIDVFRGGLTRELPNWQANVTAEVQSAVLAAATYPRGHQAATYPRGIAPINRRV